jgi:ABC-type nitrate/sulfonate/bicarbonate transport system permease component
VLSGFFWAAIEVFRTDNFLYHAGVSLQAFGLGFALALTASSTLVARRSKASSALEPR